MGTVKSDPSRKRQRAGAHGRHAEATRARIVATASALMKREGYARTAIADIAREADVAVQTVYNAVGSKREVLEAVLEFAAAGPQAPARVPDLMERRGGAATTAREHVEILADWFSEVQPRVAPTMRLIREAAAVDAEIAALETRRSSQRLAHYGLAADQLLALPGARRLPREEAAAIIWSIGHPHTYRQLVEVEGWTLESYRGWVERSLGAALLE